MNIIQFILFYGLFKIEKIKFKNKVEIYFIQKLQLMMAKMRKKKEL